MTWRHSQKIRLHLVDRPGADLPRIDGLLVSRRHGEYTVAVPSLQFTAEGHPVQPEGRFIAVPKTGVAFLEIL